MTDTTGAGTTRTEGRRVIVAEFVTLDGYMVGPDEDVSWVAVGFDPQMQEDIAVDISGTFDLFVFGRVTYEIFADYWPTPCPTTRATPCSRPRARRTPGSSGR